MKLICKCTNLRASLIALGCSKPIITLFLRRRDDGWKLFRHLKRLICLPGHRFRFDSFGCRRWQNSSFYFLPQNERKTVVKPSRPIGLTREVLIHGNAMSSERNANGISVVNGTVLPICEQLHTTNSSITSNGGGSFGYKRNSVTVNKYSF